MEGAIGELAGTDQIAWQKKRSTPYVPSPLLHEGWLYYLRHYQGVLSRVKTDTGVEPRGPFRLGPLFDIYASPVACAGRIYVMDRNGKTLVLTTDAEPRTIALNELNDRFSASAALAGDSIFLRGESFLYRIGNER